MSWRACCSINLFIALQIISTLSYATTITGTVSDSQQNLIVGATVRLQGANDSTRTQQDGTFSLNIDTNFQGKYITAWKSGYFNGGVDFDRDVTKYHIELHKISLEENKEYKWIPALANNETESSTDGSENQHCETCHLDLVKSWQKSTHATSATNPLFLSFFNGFGTESGDNAGIGYKHDFPNSNGNCVTCHIPMQAFNNPFNSDPNKAKGVEREGVSCDICHKIEAITLDSIGGNPGILSMELHRPKENQLFYGPYTDVFPGDDSFHPLYLKSQYCAPCHHGSFWNQLVYSEFQEWSESSYAKNNIHCQDCHMKPDGVTTRFVPKEKGGVLRKPETIPSHDFNGINDIGFMKDAIQLKQESHIVEDTVTVRVIIKNTKAGHHYPTGNPIRNMILLVGVVDGNGNNLELIKGSRVPVWGGQGSLEGANYAGLPGKGYAKVYRDILPYQHKTKKWPFKYRYPAPYWRPTKLESDNRIPAKGKDISEFHFYIDEKYRGKLICSAILIFRNTFKNWADQNNIDIYDLVLSEQNTVHWR